MVWGEIGRRGWLVAFFALQAAACVAAPVLAEVPAEEGEAAPPLELQRDESLETPQAAAEREGSEYAYADLNADQEASLLQESFAQQLEAIDADPARALDDVTIERLDSPTEALVTLDGKTALLESEVPLRAPEEDGDLHKVELGLEETPQGFEPANPLVDLTLPDSAQDPIGIGDEGLALTPMGAEASAATPIGNEDLLLPGVHEDTSLLLSPVAGGLELSAMLASRNSPEQLAFDVTLPPGASLRESEAGGAEVVDAGGEPIATITAPHAVDAQGTEVPASLTVQDSSLSIQVPHQELDVAYPLFVDPEITEDWTGFADTSKLSYWHWSWSGVGAEDYIGRTSCIVTCWGNGLYVRARSGFAYPAGSYGRWWYTPQGSTTYMQRVILGPIHFDAHGCWANEPHAYVGVWNDYSGWAVLGNMYPTGGMTGVDVGSLAPGTRTAFVGFHASSGSNLTCGRDYHLGGATMFLNDPENPSAGAASGYPTGWVKNGQSFMISAPASDPGLGVYAATLSPGGSPPVEKKHGCDGHYSSACPSNYTFQFPIGAASFDEGEKPVRFSATDALGKGSNTYEWNMKVDRTPPEIELAGQLALATDETEGDGKDDKDKPLPLPVYNLTVNTTDGVLSPTTGAQKRSGVKKIQVFIDNRANPEQTWESSSCPAGNCPLSKVFVLKLNELSADTDHYLRILATDFAGNAPRERKLEFEYIPATGMKDEYVMQYFPLPDGSGNEAEEEHPSRPELAVNLVSGNLVYRQQDIDVAGPAADLQTELFYNSLLPEQQNTEWGDGWTLAQTPELEIKGGGGGTPSEATIVDESAMVESKVDLPAATGEEAFDKRLQATVTKKSGGGYALSDESGESGGTVSFDSAGKAQELTNGTAATVDYEYENGDLSGIAVEDPGTANADPESIEEGEGAPPLTFLHSTNFGTYGSEDGQMKTPADVASDSQGNLWVLDRGNSRVLKYGPEGNLLSKFGTAGSGEGQLNAPSALTLDGEGNLLVADSYRVQKFTPAGVLLAKYGSLGGGSGQFLAPVTSVAVNRSDGSVWASDTGRTYRYTASGQFIERVANSGSGQISWAEGIAAGPGGEMFIVDPSLDKVKVYNAEGDFIRQFGTSGTGPGQFAKPVEIDVDSQGVVWVGDEQTDRVQAFTASGDYLAGFGGSGTGTEQLDLKERSGIVANLGRVWVADAGNNRMSGWVSAPVTSFLHSTNFGTYGSEDGQMKTPADVASDSQGNLWVLDRGNSRVLKYGPEGNLLSKFGTAGSGEGQLNAPSALTLDGEGNLLVADSYRVQKFTPAGVLLAKYGSLGGGSGQFLAPVTSVAVNRSDGSVWASDTGRTYRYTASGQFIERVANSGSGQISWAEGIAAGPGGEMFIVDPSLDKVKVYNAEGDFIRQFGTSGTGPGQFAKPVEIDVDSQGVVWVGDEQTDRVQAFTASGDYLAGFGGSGTGTEQLDLKERSGIVANLGRVWVADAGNNRLEEWAGGNYEASNEPVLTEDDPQLEVNVSEGLVDSVEGEESGTISYAHSGDLLTAVDAPAGEAQFSYDGAGHMTKVTLPNGTYGEIAYEATYARVKSVTVAVEGKNPKTTYFSWSDEPRRTTVTPPDAPATTYDIAAEGSIFKWWNAKQPPVLDSVAGTLFENRETSTPIAIGTHNLVIQAHDDEGVASIQVIANGNQLVDEHTCDFNPEKPAECVTQTDEWVTETASWPPGIVYLEVIATDRLGEATSQRFWVNIPYTPPPDPEAEEPPRFNDILKFREEFGLDLDLKGDELAVNDRIFELMGDWNNPLTPAGEVARTTKSRWGVPMRAVDLAELEYRQRYVEQAASAIQAWASANAPSTYAGYYVDHRAGGIIRVGFTQNNQATVASLVGAGVLEAGERVTAFSQTPSHSYQQLIETQFTIANAGSQLPSLTTVSIDAEDNLVKVGTTGTAQAMSNAIAGLLGASAPVEVFVDPNPPSGNATTRERIKERIRAGERIFREKEEETFECTAGFGAWLQSPSEQGGVLEKHFLITAAHCGDMDTLGLGTLFERRRYLNKAEYNFAPLGHIRRSGITDPPQVDAAAILLEGPANGWAPREIFLNSEYPQPITGATAPVEGMIVCTSGATTNKVERGVVLGDPVPFDYEKQPIYNSYEVPVDIYERHGDSGAPVWECGKGNAVGLWNAGTQPSYVTALLPIAVDSPWNAVFGPVAPGALAKLGFQPGNLSTAP